MLKRTLNMSNPPQISVVVALYNKEREVMRCVESVLRQSFADFELIIVEDGSTDRSLEIVRSVQDPRVRVVDKPNGGVAMARNRGIEEARADLIAFLDADDEWWPDFLRTIFDLSKSSPDAGAYFTAFWVERGNGWGRRVVRPVRDLLPGKNLLKNYYRVGHDYESCSAVAVWKKVFERAGYFREMIAEDTDLWMRIAAFYPIAYSRRVESVWNQDASNRRSNQHAARKIAHDPTVLHKSLEFIQASPQVSQRVKEDAAWYLGRRELRPIRSALCLGDREAAEQLVKRWRIHFGEPPYSVRIAFYLPAWLLNLQKKSFATVRKSTVATVYLRERLIPLRRRAGHGGSSTGG